MLRYGVLNPPAKMAKAVWYKRITILVSRMRISLPARAPHSCMLKTEEEEEEEEAPSYNIAQAGLESFK